MKKRTIFLAVCGESDRSFRRYSDACEWLDEINPSGAVRGFTTEDQETEEARTIIVRQAAD